MRRSLQLALAPALLIVLATMFACGRAAERPDGDVRNLLLITVDTLRADRLGCYGHAAARTPNIDALAQRGVRFDQAVCSAPIASETSPMRW